MEYLKQQITANENNIRHLITLLYGVMAGSIALFISTDFYPTGGYLYLQLIGVIFVILLGVGLIGSFRVREILFEKLRKKETS